MSDPANSQYDLPSLDITPGPYYAQPSPQTHSGETSNATFASLLQSELTQQPAGAVSHGSGLPQHHPSNQPTTFHETSPHDSGFPYLANRPSQGQPSVGYEEFVQSSKRYYDGYHSSNTPGQSHSPATTINCDTPEHPQKRRKVDSQDKRVGRPRKPDNELKRPRYNPREKPTRLRINKPLKADVNEDVWRNIFRYTDPATLLSLRSVCRVFHSILLHEDHIWAENRINMFGEDCPPPPPGLPAARDASTNASRVTSPGLGDNNNDKKVAPKGTQRQYLDLLAGRNCMACGARKTKKTLWAFLRRWCEKCYKDKTTTIDNLRNASGREPTLFYCIPRAISDKWGSYRAIGVLYDDPDNIYANTLGRLQHHVFRQSDVTRIFREYDAFCESISNEPEEEATEMKKEWRQKRIDAVDEQMRRVKDIEKFTERVWEAAKSDERATRSKYYLDRQQFFAEKASQLDPPLSEEALIKIPAVQKALKENRPPTNRAWENLREKVEKFRTYAEETVQYESNNQPGTLPYPQKEESRKIDRTSGALPVLNSIAEKVMEELSQTNIADADFPLVVLRRVWEIYSLEKKDEDLPRAIDLDLLLPDTEGGPHVLSLHDAQKVYENKIVPFMDKWSPIRSKTAQKLKCPGCTRTDYSKEWSFKGLFHHLQERHGQELGSDWIEYRRIALSYNCTHSFPFYAVPWTRNLPILAQHHRATGCWDPDDTSPYQHANPTQQPEEISPSAFTGRTVRHEPEDTVKARDLAGFAVEAANLLRTTGLPKKFVTLVAWNYMIRRSRKSADPAAPNLVHRHEILNELLKELIVLGEYAIFDGYACAACYESDTISSISSITVHYGLRGQRFGELIQHWINWHTGFRRRAWRMRQDSASSVGSEDPLERPKWPEELLLLPSEGELTDALCSPGMEKARETFEWLFPLEADAANVFANRPELAANSATVNDQNIATTKNKSKFTDSQEQQHASQRPPSGSLLSNLRQGNKQSRPPPVTMSESSGLDLLAESALRDDLRTRAQNQRNGESATTESETQNNAEIDMIAGW